MIYMGKHFAKTISYMKRSFAGFMALVMILSLVTVTRTVEVVYADPVSEVEVEMSVQTDSSITVKYSRKDNGVGIDKTQPLYIYRVVSVDGVETQACVVTIPIDSEYIEESYTTLGSYSVSYEKVDAVAAPRPAHLGAEVICDNVKPDITVTKDASQDNKYHVSIQEPSWTQGQYNCSLSYVKKTVDVYTGLAGTGTVQVTLDSGVYEGEFVLSDEGCYSDIKVSATDVYGNTGEGVGSDCVVDMAKPLIDITGDITDDTTNTLCYDAASVSIGIAVSDYHLSNQESDYIVTLNGSTVTNHLTWEPIAVGGSRVNPYKRCATLTVSGDGVYELAVTAKRDSAVSTAENSKTIRFVLDTQDPDIQISNGGLYYQDDVSSIPAIKGDAYYLKKEAGYRFNVVEAYGVNEIKIHTEYTPFDGTMTPSDDDVTSQWQSSDTVFEKQYPTAGNEIAEGDYKVLVVAKDKVGRQDTENVHFVMDKTAPLLDISGIANNAITDSSVALTFSATDMCHDFDQYTIEKEYIAPDGSKTQLSNTYPSSDWTQVGHKASKSLTFTQEGKYHLTLKAKDLAGNEGIKKEIRFELDKTAPTIQNVRYWKQDSLEMEFPYNIFFSKIAVKVSFDVTDSVTGVDKVYVTVGAPEQRTGTTPTYPAVKGLGNEYYVYIPTSVNLQEFKDTITVWAKDKVGNEGKECTRKIIYNEDYANVQITCDVDNEKWTKENVAFHVNVSDSKSGIKEIICKINGKEVKKVTPTTLVYSDNFDVTATDTATLVSGYKVEVQVTNNCGTVKTESKRVYIDKVKPEVSLSGITQNKHYNQNVKFLTTISDVSYNNTKVEYYATRTLDGVTCPVALATLNSGDYTVNEYRTLVAEGEYTIYAIATDGAGNTKQSNTLKFTIDKTAPVISFSGVKNNAKKAEPVKLKLHCKEVFYGTNEISMQVERTTDKDVFVTEYHDFHGAGKDMDYEKIFSKDGKYKIKVIALDAAGNSNEISISFMVDQTKPVIRDVELANDDGRIPVRHRTIYSNKEIAMTFFVEDAMSGVDEKKVFVSLGGNTKAQAKKILCTQKIGKNQYIAYLPKDLLVKEISDTVTIWVSDLVNNENSYTTKKVIYNKKAARISMETNEKTTAWRNKKLSFQTNVTDVKSGIKKIEYLINGKTVHTVEPKKYITSYDYKVTANESASLVTGYAVEIVALNNAGTTKRMSEQVYIDKNAPTIQLSGVVENKHYSSDVTFHTTVKDVSYNRSKVEYVVTRTLDGVTYNVPLAQLKMNDYTTEGTRTLVEEGAYTVYAVATDGAGNKTVSNTIHFVIDKTAPVLSMSGVSEGSMNNSGVTVNFECVESFFETNAVTIQVEKTLDGSTTSVAVPTFASNEKKSAMSHSFAEDGQYKITFTATDGAGNVAASQTLTFSCDSTSPEIRIGGTDNYQQWDREVKLNIEVEESFYNNNKVVITGNRTDIDGNVTKLEIPTFLNSGKISMLQQTYKEDGYYDFKVLSMDQAGNSQTKEIHFTVDQSAPIISGVDSYDGKYLQNFCLLKDGEGIFKDLTVVSYRVLLNGIEYNGTDDITEEGKYTLYIQATDELGQTREKQAEFIIDHTAPKVIFTGAKDGEVVRDSGVVTLALVNTEDQIKDVRLNNVSQGADARNLKFTSYGNYKIDVDCIDQAGNEATRTLNFTYRNPYIVALLIGGMTMLVLITCGWLWHEINKKEKEEQ